MARIGVLKARNGAQRRNRRIYSEAERESALAALAAIDGNCRRGSRVLTEKGLPVPPSTLRRWKNETHRGLYIRTRLELLPHLKQARWERLNELAHEVAPT
jgi:hypothetical protein